MTMLVSLVAMDQLNRLMGTVNKTSSLSACSESRVPSSHLLDCAQSELMLLNVNDSCIKSTLPPPCCYLRLRHDRLLPTTTVTATTSTFACNQLGSCMYSLKKNKIHPHFIFFHNDTFCKFIYFSVSGLFIWLLCLCNQFQLNVGVNLEEAEEM